MIKLATPEDAPALLELQRVLDRESTFMLLEPGERGSVAEVPGEPSFLLLDEGGYVQVEVLPYVRARRTGYVVMGVRSSHGGQGLGRRLLEAAAEQARTRGLWRLELTVMAHNRRAIGLYLGVGFQVEGLRRAALEVEGVRVDEYYMGMLL
ncbi:MAG: GNAT family N-acetyltransferase [Nonomuraea sp.]|nr:GNAT family N-acetyltransferase [Nonomuraea sp.]